MPRTKQPPRLRDRITCLRRLPASALQDHQHNWRVHPQAQREALQGVLHELGIASALLVYDSPRQGGLCVIDGHLRKSLDPTQEWPCLMLDLDDDEASYLLATHDPLGAMAEASREALAQVLADVTSGQAAVQELLAQLAEQHGVVPADTPGPLVDVEPEIDRAEELRQQYGVEVGQLWVCGAHRVICGDCTDKAVVDRLMQGDKAALCLADPPYNVGFAYDEATGDDTAEPEAYAAFCCAWFRLAQHRSPRQIITPGCNNLGMWLRLFPAFYVAPWIKTNAMTHGYISRFFCWEPIVFLGGTWFEGDETLWRRQRAHDVFEYPIAAQAMEDGTTLTGLHPCPKPLKLWTDFLASYTYADDMIYDPFLGSGSTLAACAQQQRVCRGVELSPAYLAVSLHRYATLTGETPVLVDV